MSLHHSLNNCEKPNRLQQSPLPAKSISTLLIHVLFSRFLHLLQILLEEEAHCTMGFTVHPSCEGGAYHVPTPFLFFSQLHTRQFSCCNRVRHKHICSVASCELVLELPLPHHSVLRAPTAENRGIVRLLMIQVAIYIPLNDNIDRARLYPMIFVSYLCSD